MKTREWGIAGGLAPAGWVAVAAVDVRGRGMAGEAPPQVLEALWQFPVLLHRLLLEAPIFGPCQRCHGPFNRPRATRATRHHQP